MKKNGVGVWMILMGEFGNCDTRSSLLGRVKDLNDDGSWRTFYSIYTKLIRSQALRAGLHESEADDVVQDTIIEVSRRLGSFRYDRQAGSFKAWLFQLARWRIINEFKRRTREPVSLESIGSEKKDAADIRALAVSPNEAWEREWQQAIFDAAFGSLRRKWPLKQYQAITFLIVNQWSIPQVCQVLGMTRTHLYVLRFRAVHQLKREVARLKARPEQGLTL